MAGKDKNSPKKYKRRKEKRGQDALWDYFLDLRRTDYFLNDVEKIIDKCKGDYRLEIKGKSTTYLRLIDRLAIKNGLDPVEWSAVLQQVVQDIWIQDNKLKRPNSLANLCRAENFPEFSEKNKDLVSVYKRIFPVAIFVSPEATSNNIKRYISDHYSLYIKPKQEELRNSNIKIKGKRAKNPELRKLYDRIYEWRNLPPKIISKQLKREFPNRKTPEVWEMSKAISIAKTRRS